MNNIAKIVVGIVIGMLIVCFGNAYSAKQFDKMETIATVHITNDYINVRQTPTPRARKTYEVLEGEEYEGLKIYDGDEYYIWYQIKFSHRRTGWIANDRTAPYLEIVK